METENKFCVIGAGFVGLGIAKALKQADIPYDQFDADAAVGGNWYHGVYRHVHIISSKKTTEFTDFPMPDSYPDFPSAGQMLAYLNAYADHFGLRQHITLNKAVALVLPTANEKFEITFADGEKRIYKGVLVCNGHHWDCRMPEYPGVFTGELMHTKHYQNSDCLQGKRVLVIGGGNSACDVAVDAARVAESSDISMRRGYWFMPKTLMGRPSVEFINPWLPVWAQRLLLKSLFRIVIGRYTDYGLPQPDHNIFEHHPTINSELLYFLKHGRITPRPDIARWDGKTVTFTNGQTAEYDLVVCGTGYHLSFPFLPPGLVPVKNLVPQIPRGVFHPVYKHLYIIGTNQARYGVGPLVTAGGAALCEAIKVQDQMQMPMGAVLQKMGIGAPKTHLADPMQALAAARRARRQLKIVAWLEKRYRKNYTQPAPAHNFATIEKPTIVNYF